MSTNKISIGKFSLLTRLSKKALRLYDENGLLVPKAKEYLTGYRYYTSEQIEVGIKIKNLCEIGFSLKEVKQLLSFEAKDDFDSIENLFNKKIIEVKNEFERLKKVEKVLLSQKKHKRLLKMSFSDLEIKKVPAVRVISMREKGKYEEVIPKLIGELFGFAFNEDNKRSHVAVTGPPMLICHDGEYKKIADIECAVPISGKVVMNREDINVRTLEECEVISTIHKGRYQDVGPSYDKIVTYARKNNLELQIPARELYLNDPNEVKEEDILTEVQWPVKKL